MAREMPGGSYVMDNSSFGRMMLSEQLRQVLYFVGSAIRNDARSNTLQSSGPGPMAASYQTTRGPVVTLVVDGRPSPRISNRVINPLRYAAAREFGKGGYKAGKGTRDLRRAGMKYGDLAGEAR